MMLTEILQYLKNWFEKTKYYGTVTISNGRIDTGGKLPLVDGQYVRIIGSPLNSGVWAYPDTHLRDEVFEGAVWGLAIPPAVVALANEISQWQTKNGDVAASPYQSESFANYSYNKGSGSANDDVSWQTVYKSRLSAWRKI